MCDPVTTQGATTYERASLFTNRRPTNKASTKSRMLDLASRKNYVCKVPLSSIDPSFISHYGDISVYLSYVNKTSNGFESSYLNAELNCAVPLGAYSDENTASLAHAITRTNSHYRVTPYAVQDYIERLHMDSSLSLSNLLPESDTQQVIDKNKDDTLYNIDLDELESWLQ